MAITWKILDADGPQLVVKYTADDGRSRTVMLMWNGRDDIAVFLSMACPLPPDPPAAVNASEHVGKTGTVTVPLPPLLRSVGGQP